MAEATDNNIDIDLFDKLQIDNEVQTTSKRLNPVNSQLLKLTHPPSAVPGFEGLSTNDTRSQVVLEWKSVGIINTPLIYDYNQSKTRYATDPRRYAFLVTNGARVLAMSFCYNESTGSEENLTQDLSGVIYNENININTWAENSNLYRPVARSLTTYLNATAFNNTGIVSGVQFNPNILFQGILGTLAKDNLAIFVELVKRKLKLGYNVVSRKPVLVNRSADTPFTPSSFDKFPKYIRDELRDRLHLTTDEEVDLDPNAGVQIFNIGELGPEGNPGGLPTIVPTPTQMVNMSTRAYTGKATEGTFGVSRLNTVSPAWLSGSNTVLKDPHRGLFECWYFSIAPDGGPTLTPFLENAKPGAGPNELYPLMDTMWSKDMTWQWHYYQGLTTNAQATPSTSIESILAYKIYATFEIQPTPRSAWSGLQKLAPKPNVDALQQVLDAFYDIKDVLPCKYNFLGGLATIAKKGLSFLGNTFMDGLSKKEHVKDNRAERQLNESKDIRTLKLNDNMRQGRRNIDKKKGWHGINEANRPEKRRRRPRRKPAGEAKIEKELDKVKEDVKASVAPTPKPRRPKWV
jgi:hypothetical protein